MALEHVLLTNLAAIGAVLFLLWCWSLLLRNVAIVDIFWGCGFVLIAWASLWASGGLLPKPLLLTLMVSVWGLRLAGYLAWRNIGKPEDYRYADNARTARQAFPGCQFVLSLRLAGPLNVDYFVPDPGRHQPRYRMAYRGGDRSGFVADRTIL